MKNSIRLFAAIVMMAGFSTTMVAQSETTGVGALIVTALQLTESSAMHFGTMTVPTTLATVILDVNGDRTNTGTVGLLSAPIAASAAAYDVTGDASETYFITHDASTTITNGTALYDMTVDEFVCSYATWEGTLDGSGDSSFSIGATLNLADDQPVGTYSGTFDISIAYN